MSVFRFNDYRDVLVDQIKGSKSESNGLTYSALADAINVQKAYVTRVLKKDAHLNSDQLYLACEFLKLTPEETDYLFLLLERGRSVVQARRKELQKKINEIQSQHRDTRKHLKAEMLQPLTHDELSQYYLDPLAPLVHTFVSLPAYARDTTAIAQKLNISEKRLKQITETLERLKIIKWNETAKAYQVQRDHMQLVADSPLNLPYQVFQRTNALFKFQTQSLNERFIFSVTFSATETTKNEIHEEFLKFLQKAEACVKDSTPSEIYQMNFDLFGWS